MKRLVAALLSFMVMLLSSEQAQAWSHANRYGGGTAHTWRGTVHTNAFGGGTAHAYGEGTVHANPYGGTTWHAYGSGGAVHTNAYRTTTAYTGYDHYYGGYPAAYHPPVAVHSYSSCYNCGGWSAAAGAAVGAAAGIAIGAAAASAQTSAAASNAYNSGYVAGSSAAVAAYAMGAIYATLPAGCTSPNVSGETYYLCGNTWFSPSYGANGVTYRVVPTP